MLRKTMVGDPGADGGDEASMRPQRNAAENLPTAGVPLMITDRFNEAAA